jgi:hypothetical protein
MSELLNLIFVSFIITFVLIYFNIETFNIYYYIIIFIFLFIIFSFFIWLTNGYAICLLSFPNYQECIQKPPN